MMENIFICNGCKLDFNKLSNIPKVLNCGHSVCLPCIRKILIENQCCPNCGKKEAEKKEDNFPVNLSLLYMMEACESYKAFDNDSVYCIQKLKEKYSTTKDFLIEKEAIIKSKLLCIESGLETLEELNDSENPNGGQGKLKESLLTLEKNFERLNKEILSNFGIPKQFVTVSLGSFKDENDYLHEIYSKLKHGEKVFSVECIENNVQFAQLSERDNMILMHSFSYSEVPQNSSVILFSELKRCFLSKQLCTFLKISTSLKDVTHLIIIEMVWNLPFSFDFIKLCTGECGPSYKNSLYVEDLNKHMNSKQLDFVFPIQKSLNDGGDKIDVDLVKSGNNSNHMNSKPLDFVFPKQVAHDNGGDKIDATALKRGNIYNSDEDNDSEVKNNFTFLPATWKLPNETKSGSTSNNTGNILGSGSTTKKSMNQSSTSNTDGIFGSGSTTNNTGSIFGSGSTNKNIVSESTTNHANKIFASGSTTNNPGITFGSVSTTNNTGSSFGTAFTIKNIVSESTTNNTSNLFASGSTTNNPGITFGSGSTTNNTGSNIPTFKFCNEVTKDKMESPAKDKMKSNVLKAANFKFSLPSHNFNFQGDEKMPGKGDKTSNNKTGFVFQLNDQISVNSDILASIILSVDNSSREMNQKLNFEYYHKAVGTSRNYTMYQPGDIILTPGSDYSFGLIHIKKQSGTFKSIGKVIHPQNLGTYLSYENPDNLKVLDCGILFEI
ncbi:hypothetical protein Avbf_15725 [Armadillidium vulgare]|nr:hypothetical protein Avbf_15725 [Armadillidium vulgare]